MINKETNSKHRKLINSITDWMGTSHKVQAVRIKIILIKITLLTVRENNNMDWILEAPPSIQELKHHKPHNSLLIIKMGLLNIWKKMIITNMTRNTLSQMYKNTNINMNIILQFKIKIKISHIPIYANLTNIKTNIYPNFNKTQIIINKFAFKQNMKRKLYIIIKLAILIKHKIQDMGKHITE